MHASNHTRLINKFNGLCKNDPKWPSTLHDLGYKVHLVEYKIHLQESGTIQPDIVAVSKKALHAIVSDCKGGSSFSTDQDRRYASLDSRDLEQHVTVHDPKRLSHDACYVDIEDNHASLEGRTQLPFITFGRDSISKHGTPRYEQLNKTLDRPIPLVDAREPTSYYPFSPSDTSAVIVPHVLRALVACLTARRRAGKIDYSEVADQIFSRLYSAQIIQSQHEKDLKKTISQILSRLLDNYPKLKAHTSKLESEYNTATLQALASVCSDVAEQHESQTRITDEHW